jgi:hypothetical protein
MTPDGSDLITTIQAMPDVEYLYRFRLGPKGKWFCDASSLMYKTDKGIFNVFTIELYKLIVPEITHQEIDNIDLKDDQRGPEDPLNAYTSSALAIGNIH